MSNAPATREAWIRNMQIIAGALIAGVVVFALVAVFVLGALSQPLTGVIVSYMALGMTAMEMVPFALVPRFVTAQTVHRARQGAGNLEGDALQYGLYQTRMILRYALLEGAAFFCIVATIIEHNWWTLGMAGGLVLIMLTIFPTRTRVEHWIETQRMNQG
jgi:hypothetical protein